MRLFTSIALFVFVLVVVCGCALGKKEWPSAVKSEDTFALKIVDGVRQNECLMLEVSVTGATHRIWRASVQMEAVGLDEGDGCAGCPFVPRSVAHFQRDHDGFDLQGNTLKLSVCTLDPTKEYRFRVMGKSELSTSPLVFTDVFEALP